MWDALEHQEARGVSVPEILQIGWKIETVPNLGLVVAIVHPNSVGPGAE